MQDSARRPPTLGPNPRTWAIGPPLGSYELVTSTITITALLTFQQRLKSTMATHLVVLVLVGELGATLFKISVRLRRFKWDRDDIFTRDVSSSKCTSIDRSLIWCHTFKTVGVFSAAASVVYRVIISVYSSWSIVLINCLYYSAVSFLSAECYKK